MSKPDTQRKLASEDSVHMYFRDMQFEGLVDQATMLKLYPTHSEIYRRVEGNLQNKHHTRPELTMHRKIIKAVPDIFDYRPLPLYDTVRVLKDFETADKANKRRKSLVKFLHKYLPGEVSLASALDACSADSRCRLLSCPVCMRALRRWVCGQLAPIVAENPEKWTCATLIPERHRHSGGTLHQFDPQHLIDALRKAVKKYGPCDAIVFGSIDYSEEISGNPAGGPVTRVWCPELSVMSNISVADWRLIKICLEQYFRRSPNVHAPIRVEALRTKHLSLLRPISYRIKATYDTRFKNTYRKGQPSPQVRGSTRQRKPMRMHGKMQAELASAMARWRRKDRLVLIGLKGVKKSIVRTKLAR
ncbi:hypothetical protein MKK69_25835 [Methylobacterium sp. J-026]|uniref:hypothetical protein n=1 Tax=Methylobacterium sp. J-026 TaxID=2836624 RepID=UPI001FBAA042|nr:hypothetical protein [Methylobacterium sp. J-026]MCJ2137421.1 hypothetical protein [Methylobacterium sp. J-026]